MVVDCSCSRGSANITRYRSSPSTKPRRSLGSDSILLEVPDNNSRSHNFSDLSVTPASGDYNGFDLNDDESLVDLIQLSPASPSLSRTALSSVFPRRTSCEGSNKLQSATTAQSPGRGKEGQIINLLESDIADDGDMIDEPVCKRPNVSHPTGTTSALDELRNLVLPCVSPRVPCSDESLITASPVSFHLLKYVSSSPPYSSKACSPRSANATIVTTLPQCPGAFPQTPPCTLPEGSDYTVQYNAQKSRYLSGLAWWSRMRPASLQSFWLRFKAIRAEEAAFLAVLGMAAFPAVYASLVVCFWLGEGLYEVLIWMLRGLKVVDYYEFV